MSRALAPPLRHVPGHVPDTCPEDLVTLLRVQSGELSEAHEQLRQTEERLREVQARLVEREKLASLGALTAGIAHELRNPLNFITNFAAVSIDLLDELGEGLPAQAAEPLALVRENLGKIDQHGRRADRIISGILTHSRAGSTERHATDVNELLAESLYLTYHSFRARHAQTRVELRPDYDARIAPIQANGADLQRVFVNLFDNALYSATRKRTRPVHDAVVSVSTRELGHGVEIRVHDNGAGIPPANLAKLFTPFFTTKPAGEGLGLGLSICHDVIREHRGTIRAESVEGEYAEFVIMLPRR